MTQTTQSAFAQPLMSSRLTMSASAIAQTRASGRKSMNRKKLSQNVVASIAALLESTNRDRLAAADQQPHPLGMTVEVRSGGASRTLISARVRLGNPARVATE